MRLISVMFSKFSCEFPQIYSPSCEESIKSGKNRANNASCWGVTKWCHKNLPLIPFESNFQILGWDLKCGWAAIPTIKATPAKTTLKKRLQFIDMLYASNPLPYTTQMRSRRLLLGTSTRQEVNDSIETVQSKCIQLSRKSLYQVRGNLLSRM